MDAAPVLKSIHSQTLDLPPSCLQFCRKHPSYFVIGTYNLQSEEGGAAEIVEAEPGVQKKSQNRNGSLLVFDIGEESTPKLSLIQTISQPSAVLDIRFNNEIEQSQDILAAIS
ncbi:hypothetical protein ARSEF4850_009765, partial [Beauveria asiatica]